MFCGSWYEIRSKGGPSVSPLISSKKGLIERTEPIVLAFDIETTKFPLKLPDTNTDQIMMISYIIDGLGFLITSTEILFVDFDDFEYIPKPEFEENVQYSMNIDHISEIRPHIFVTYSGDFFD